MKAMTTGLAGRISMILVLAMLLSITLPAYAADKAINGPVTISTVTDKAGSININVGKGEGIKEGAKGTVVRDGKQIAEYVVQQVNWGFSRIQLMNVVEGYTVRPGDGAPLSGAAQQQPGVKKKSSKSKTLLTILAVGAAVLLLGGKGGGGGSSDSGSIALTAKKVSTGEDTRTITVTAKVNDASGYAVPDGTQVLFSSTAGSLDKTETTTRAGRATATLTYDAAVDPDTAVVTVRSLGRTATIEVSFVTSIDLVVSPDTIQVSGSGGAAMQSTVTATCWDALGNLATSGEVKFTASRGTITPATVTINGSGQAVATFTSNYTGDADITATWSRSTQTETCKVTAGPPYTITVTTDSNSLECSGNSFATIRATIKDLKGTPVTDNTVVNFSVIPDGSGGGNGTITPQATTENGVATAYLYTRDAGGVTSLSGLATVRVQVLRANQPAEVPLPATDLSTQSMQVQFIAGEVGEINLSASPTNIRGWDRATQTATITAVVKNTDNQPVPNGTRVNWTATHGIITASSTTSNGVTTATLRADASGGVGWTGSVDITAEAKGVTESRPGLVIFSGAPVDANSEATLSQATLAPLNGQASILVTAHDVNDNPVEDGTTVTVLSDKGTVSNSGNGTTSGGTCMFTLSTSTDPDAPTPTGAGSVTVRITTKDGDTTITKTIPFTVGP